MIVKVKKEDLKEAVERAIKGVSARSTVPILQSFLLEASDGFLSVLSTNLSIGIKTRIIAETDEVGAICVEAKLLSEIVKKAPGEEIFIEADNFNNVNIRSLFTEFNIKGADPGEYPTLPDIKKGNSITLKQEHFKQIIEKVAFSAAKEELRPILTGILIEISNGSITVVTSDGYRVTTATSDLESDVKETKFIVPAKDLMGIIKILKEGDMTLEIHDKHVVLLFDTTEIILRRLEGEFIKYKDFLNLKGEEIRLKRSEILNSLERMMLFSDEKINMVVIKISKGEMILSSKSVKGSAREKIKVETEIEKARIGINTKFLYEALKATESEDLILRYTGEIQPFYIIDKGYINLTLPVKLVDEEEEAA
ncbi:DNA polymerase III subunit beta [Caldanaerobacter subterraneus]|uniref:Beta sliding clamp n=1 Tax=Caldanaerobacter subterraneus TaxID=911092 RepID=A0A7Y2LAQ4_9THEO|nr:DNA polymerase III subunit beta [Caldanaerobacter subterraneus]NNG67531.1 DNA polymerase III subunit beta [Caldanaerobacter subterraneus]